MVAANVEDLIAGHSLDPDAARIFLAARELAHTALFSAAPWLGRALFSAVEDFARGITLDLDALDEMVDRKSTRLNSSHVAISYAVFCLKKKKKESLQETPCAKWTST